MKTSACLLCSECFGLFQFVKGRNCCHELPTGVAPEMTPCKQKKVEGVNSITEIITLFSFSTHVLETAMQTAILI